MAKQKKFNIPRKKGKETNWKNLNRSILWRIKAAKRKKETAKYSAFFQKKLKHCPICNNKQYQTFVIIYGYKYAECKSCGHIFMQPPLDLKAVRHMYSGGKKSSMQDKIYINNENLFKKRIKQIATPKVEYCNGIIKKKGVWIDIGCGVGEMLIAAEKTGWKVFGIEPDLREVKFAKQHGLNVAQDFITTDNAEQLRDADVVSLISVLEHINNPSEFLQNIVNALPRNAYVIIEVPRHPSLSSFVNLVFPNLAYRHIHSPEHLHIFTEKSLATMFSRARLKAVGMWEFGQDVSDLILLAAANASKKESQFIGMIYKLVPDLQKVVDEKSMSDTIFIVTKKF
ncbi:MAG: class I SAM-dependent methyltransferase [Candidatus Niyogibacteria bacterium]|nr:class I SAM-dependent methyltransferase [Candidatus Niyogibacteria bacterium]